jgi:RNA polymerase sigma-70 factor (ECF subfamily)
LAEDDEARWLAQAKAGDMHAFSRLVRLHQSAVRRQLQRLVPGDRARADELAQITFVQVWRGLARFRGEARLSTWLHRIAYRCFLQDLRARASPVASALVPAPECGAESCSEFALSAATDAERLFALRADVDRALADLPLAERAAIVHCFHLDLSHEEAAEVLGMPLGTLKSHVARGKVRLRKALAAWKTEA